MSGATPPPPDVLGALIAFLAWIAISRVAELVISARHTRRLVARGAVEHGREHFVWFVILHTLFPVALACEVLFLGARPPQAWAWWAAVFAVAQALRFATIQALGEYWNVRVWVVPGMVPVRGGPYRFLRHPNYVAVVLEFLAVPLAFGAWRTALAASVLNLALLTVRIAVEERALRGAAAEMARAPAQR